MADKLTLPKAKFSHELAPAPVDATMKAAEAKAGKVHMVPVDKIKTIPGFNIRVETPDYIEHRDNIRNLISANGYDPTKPIAGYVAKEGDENVIYVTDGHTRLAAVNEHNADPDTAEKDEIAAIPVIVHPKEVSLSDLTIMLHTANSGRPLSPFELGVLVKRLLTEEGESKNDIAVKLGVTTRYLDDVLLLANADKKIKQHIASGVVASTMAIQMLRANPETAADKIEAAVKKAGDGKKVTKKNVGPKMVKTKLSHSFEAGDDMKEIVKAIAALVRSTVSAEEGEDDVKTAATDGTVNLVIELPAPDKPKAEKKPKAKKSAEKKAKVKAEAPAADKKAKSKTKPKKDTAEPESEEVSAEGEDDEVAMTPPKVKSDPDVPDDEDDIDI